MRLEGKIAVITGGGLRLGRAAASLFAGEGATVFIIGSNEALGEETRNAIKQEGGDARFIPTDVLDVTSVKHAFDTVERECGALDILYNASEPFCNDDAAVLDLDVRVWTHIIDMNLKSLLYCSKCAIPLMIKSGGGAILHTAGCEGLLGIPERDAFTASMGAVIALTRSMAVEYAKMNIRVNCIVPAGIYPLVFQSPRLGKGYYKKTTLMGRMGSAEEAANTALFLLSGEASYVNGAVVSVDGGISITNCYQ